MADPGEIRVQDEQGTVHVFPSGSTPEMIAQAMGVKVSAPTPPPQESAVSRFGKSFLSGLGITSNEAAKNFFEHPINSAMSSLNAQGELAVKAKDAYSRGDYKGAVIHGINYLLPFIGTQTDQAGEQLSQGDIAGGVGRTLGVAAPMVAGSPEVKVAVGDAARQGVSKVALLGKTPAEAYQSALKPSTTIPPAKVAGMVQTGLREGIPVSRAGVEKLGSLIDDVNQKIAAEIQSDPTRPINPQAVATRADQIKGKFATQVNPTADLEAIDASKQEFLKNNPQAIPAADAQAMKQGTYQQLSGKAYGELKSASIEAQKALARGLKEELAQAFPELNQLNAQDSKLYDLQPILEKAVQREANHQLGGIGTPITAGAAKAVTGSNTVAAVAGAMKAIVDNPNIKSRLAIALSKSGGMTIPAANARVAAYSAALAASSVPRADQTSSQSPQP